MKGCVLTFKTQSPINGTQLLNTWDTWVDALTILTQHLACLACPDRKIVYWAATWQSKQNGMCAQQRLRSAWAFTQSDQSSQCAQWVAKDPMFLHADSKHSNQTGRIPRLIWVFAGRTGRFVSFVVRRLLCKNWLAQMLRQHMLYVEM